MLFYKVPAPNEALVIAGAKGIDGAPLRVATGKGVFVWPWRSRARSVSLDLRQAQLNEPCVTKQGITLGVQAVAVFKVGNDSESIINAATRFLDQQDQVATTIGRVLAGHLRSTVGNMTVEEIISSRDTLAQQIKSAASDEMQKMGLDLDAFQIQEITDPSGLHRQHRRPARRRHRARRADRQGAGRPGGRREGAGGGSPEGPVRRATPRSSRRGSWPRSSRRRRSRRSLARWRRPTPRRR